MYFSESPEPDSDINMSQQNKLNDSHLSSVSPFQSAGDIQVSFANNRKFSDNVSNIIAPPLAVISFNCRCASLDGLFNILHV